MQANELKGLNWVEYDGKYYQVSKIDTENELKELGYIGSVNLKQTKQNPIPISAWCELINPIPLTEEILLKAGWSYYNGKQVGDLTKDTSCKIDLDFVSNQIQIKSHYEPFEMYRPLKHIKYLHQLQNFYFDIENLELKIQL